MDVSGPANEFHTASPIANPIFPPVIQTMHNVFGLKKERTPAHIKAELSVINTNA